MNRIRILATSDVHGYIYPYTYDGKGSADLGFGRIKTVIDSLKDENTLILDNGDVLEGSPLSFYHFHELPDEVSPMTIAMNEIGYDYINVGNHDFNYGEEALMMHLQNSKAPCITSNFFWQGKPYGPTYVIREFNNVKVALFGLVTQYIPQWEKAEHIKHCRFTDALQTAKKTVDTIRRLEHPDYIICLYHGGFERDLKDGYPTEDLTGENEGWEICRQVPGIDVLISGHQHRSLSGRLFHTAYTQTADNGREIACIDLYPGTGRIETSIIPCTLPADTDLLSRTQAEEDKCQTWLDQTLGTSKVDLTIKDEDDARLHKSQLVTFLNQVTLEATGADIAANAIFLHATGFGSEITMRNLVSTYVFPNTLAVKKVTGKVLREYLEKDAEFFQATPSGIGVSPEYVYPKPQQYNYDMLDGIEYTIKVSNPRGHRIISLTRNGEEITDDMEFTLAVNNYRAAGGGNYFMLKKAPTVKEISSSMVELLAEYIMEHRVIDFKPVNNIHVIL